MNQRFRYCHRIVIAAAVLALGAAVPGIASARRLWQQGRNISPHLQQCARQHAADHATLTAWFSCMRGQTAPPPSYEAEATAEYWTLRRKCKSKYNAMLQAHRAYLSCEKREKNGRHGP